MKTLVTKQVGLLMIALVAISVGTTYAITQSDDVVNTASSLAQGSNTQMLGHLEVIVRDSDGNIKDYRQSDNAIVRHGMAILASQTFAGLNYSQTGQVKAMQIGSGGETAPVDTDVGLNTLIGGCGRQAVSFTNETAQTVPTDLAQIAVNSTVTFLGTNCADGSIDEAAVFNDLSGGLMFARNTFSAVNLLSSDSLQLDWDFVFTDS